MYFLSNIRLCDSFFSYPWDCQGDLLKTRSENLILMFFIKHLSSACIVRSAIKHNSSSLSVIIIGDNTFF